MVVKTKLQKSISILILCLISISSFAQQISIDQTLTTQQLVQDILISSPCVETSNFTSFTGIDDGHPANGIAVFNRNGADFPFEEGILLTTGDSFFVSFPNIIDLSDGGWSGDSDLEDIIGLNESTHDASFIQFDFIPLIEEFSFNFILASEEYNQQFECAFDDAFAFILTDNTTGDSINLAVLPGTNTPITVRNIRPDVTGPPASCPAVNEELFDRYNFEPFNSPNQAAMNMNGQTIPLTASAPVTVGNPYTVKLVVVDDSDTTLNTTIFIEGGTFEIGGVSLGEDLLIANGNAPCQGSTHTLDATIMGGITSYTWTLNGNVIPGETNPTLDVTQPGTYGVMATSTGGGCQLDDEIVIEFMTGGNTVDLGNDITQCGGNVTLTLPPQGNGVTYVWSLNGNEIVGETTNTLEVTASGTYSVEVLSGGCSSTDEIIVDITPVNINFDLGQDISTCFENPVILDATPSNQNLADVSFEWIRNGAALLSETNPTLEVTESGIYEVNITIIASGCEVSDTIEVSLADISVDLGSDLSNCFSGTEMLTATVTNFNVANTAFTWSLNGTIIPGETNQTLEIVEAGTYTVDISGGVCSAMDTIEVSAVDIVVDLGTDFDSCFTEGSETLTATLTNVDASDVTFSWSLNGTVVPGETNATLEITEPGTYTVETITGICTAMDTIEVTTQNDLIVTVSEDIEICPNEPQTLVASTDNTDITYQWLLNGEPIVNATNATLEIISPLAEGNYTIQITRGICTAEAEVSVTTSNNCSIINTISQGLSPDGSPGINDSLDLTFLANRSGIENLQIHNRHGRIVFEQSQYVNQWRGQSQGNNELLPTGTYFYVISFTNEDPEYGRQTTGWIYINRTVE